METKLYEGSQKGLKLIEEAIEKLLIQEYEGLTNSEIARSLGLESSQEGKQSNYLTYSILGLMMDKGLVKKIKNKNHVLYKINK